MDNCSIHHDEEIRQLIVDECGIVHLLLNQAAHKFI
jgi:hypothetical protein